MNLPQIHAGLEQMRCIRMSERVHRRVFIDTAFFERCAKRILHITVGHGPVGHGRFVVASAGRRKNPRGIAMRLPILAQPFKRDLRQRHVAILAAFAVMNVNEPATAINIADLQLCAFGET